MGRTLFRRPLTAGHALVVLVLAAVIGGGAFAVAAIPGPDKTIKGCFKSSGSQKGALRVVDHNRNCARGERTLRWNQKGVRGATGARGPAGANGAPGTQGPQGLAGSPGAQGAQGGQGIQGPTGPAGPTESGFAHRSSGPTLNTTPTEVVRLGDTANGGTGALTVAAPARILVTGSVEIFKGTADAALKTQAACGIQRSSDGFATSPTAVGQTMAQQLW